MFNQIIEVNFEKIKLWLVIILIQAGSFGMGMYTAKTYWKSNISSSSSINYTTESDKNQSIDKNTNTKNNDQATTETSNSNNLDSANCTSIKGNISGTNKTYHIPGGSFYDRTTPEMCFSTENEAQAAGFKKSSR